MYSDAGFQPRSSTRSRAVFAQLSEQVQEQHLRERAQQDRYQSQLTSELDCVNHAGARAEALLISMLSPEQRKQYKASRSFEVIVNTNRYRIEHGWAGNVFLLDPSGAKTEKFCIHAELGTIPYEDNMLAQKLMLETNEDLFLQIANRSVHRPGGGDWVPVAREPTETLEQHSLRVRALEEKEDQELVDWQQRCSTWIEAEHQHELAVRLVEQRTSVTRERQPEPAL